MGDLPDTRVRAARAIVFQWEYTDESVRQRGEGFVRVTPPDSAQLDLFLNGGYVAGTAHIVADSVTAPGSDVLRSVLPPPAFFWAALGTLDVIGADTVKRVDAGVLTADIGPTPRWRVAFAGNRLIRLERIVNGRRIESLTRPTDSVIRYRNETTGRTLSITVTRSEGVPPQ
jgi:hypothetical protein